MSNKTQLQENNTKLTSLIAELQGKAAGGSGGGVETSTVTLTFTGNAAGYGEGAKPDLYYSVYTNNGCSFEKLTMQQDSMTINNVPINTSIVLSMLDPLEMIGASISSQNITTYGIGGTEFAFVPTDATASITIS